MPDSLRKAKYIRQQAAECTKLAEHAASNKDRNHYMQVAEAFVAMARAELVHAEEIARTAHQNVTSLPASPGAPHGRDR